jgi:hypothetical protein
MRPHPKIRKTVKWGGAVSSVLLLVVWVGSWWWSCGVEGNRSRIGVEVGDFWGTYYRSAPAAQTSASAADLSVQTRVMASQPVTPSQPDEHFWFRRIVPTRLSAAYWWIRWAQTPRVLKVIVPVWIPAAMSLGVAVVAWRLKEMARGKCPSCDYDRTGLGPGAMCPECGAAAQRASV